MPLLDGYQLAKKIRKMDIGHKFKIVCISAEENYHNNYSNVFDEIYVKPISK